MTEIKSDGKLRKLMWITPGDPGRAMERLYVEYGVQFGKTLDDGNISASVNCSYTKESYELFLKKLVDSFIADDREVVVLIPPTMYTQDAPATIVTGKLEVSEFSHQWYGRCTSVVLNGTLITAKDPKYGEYMVAVSRFLMREEVLTMQLAEYIQSTNKEDPSNG